MNWTDHSQKEKRKSNSINERSIRGKNNDRICWIQRTNLKDNVQRHKKVCCEKKTSI